MLKVEAPANGPCIITSERPIVYSDSRDETKTGAIALCRYGSSHSKSYYDGNPGRLILKAKF